MLKKGLTFAPAVSGDEAAYQALHSALAAYNSLANQKKLETREAKDNKDE
jgi:hypothetical protein